MESAIALDAIVIPILEQQDIDSDAAILTRLQSEFQNAEERLLNLKSAGITAKKQASEECKADLGTLQKINHQRCV